MYRNVCFPCRRTGVQPFDRIIVYTGVSRFEDITAGGDFLGLCDKKIHINMCPILDDYGFMTAWNLEEKVRIIDNERNKIINQRNTWYI